MLRIIRYTAYGLIALFAAFWAVTWLKDDGGGLNLGSMGLSLPGSVSVGGPFTLTDTAGATVTDATFRGRWMLIYFGYTYCPDVCPTELQTIAAALDQMGAQADKIVPIFITVDPDRDTPAHMAEYVKLFHDRLIGLTGTTEQVAAAAKTFRVYYAKTQSKTASDYLMDHSSFVYLVGPDGQFRALLKGGTPPEVLAKSIQARMASG